MAKKMNLLLTLTLAVVCLAALLGAVLLPTATPAQAATYEFSSETEFIVSDTPILIVSYNAQSNPDNSKNYHALSVNESGAVVMVGVDADGTNVTSEITNNMLWKVQSAGGNYIAFYNVGTEKYLTHAMGLADSIGDTSKFGKNGTKIYISGADEAFQVSYRGVLSVKMEYAGTSFQVYNQVGGNSGDDEPQGVTRYMKSTLPTEANVTKTGILVATVDGADYALTMGSSSTTSASFTGTQAVVLNGNYVSQISQDRSNHSNLIVAQDLPGWLTWNITKTSTGYTIQTNIETSLKNNYLYLKSYSGLYTQSDKVEPTLKFDENNSFAFDKVLNSGTSYAYIALNSNKNQFAYTVSENYVYFTFYEAKSESLGTTHNVTFDSGNSAATGEMAPVSTAAGDYTLPKCGFTYSLHKFAGWKVNGTGETLAAGATVTITEDTQLVAQWEENWWNVTLKMDGQTDHVEKVAKEGSLALSDNTKWWAGSTPAGKMFSHWTSDGEDKLTGNYTPSADVTLTAVFADAISISFDGNGGTMSSTYANGATAAANGTYKLPSYASSCSRTDYELVGYHCSLHDEVHALGSTCQLGTEDVTYTAQWRYEGYTLTFKVAGQEDIVKLVPKTERNLDETTTYTLDVNDPVVSGSKFNGWYLDDNTEKLWKKGDTMTTVQLRALTNRQGTFVASLSELKTYTVTLHYGSTTKQLQFVEGTKNILFNQSTFTDNEMGVIDDDHTFGGWFKDSELTTQMATSYLTANDEFENLHLYAKVSAYFHVLFDWGFKANASDETNIVTDRRAVVGSQGVTALYSESGSDYHEREKYTLLGWATEQGGAVVYAADGRTNVTAPCTLYAVWDYDFYVVTIKLAGASEPVGTAEVAKNRKGNTTFKINELKDADDHLVISWSALNSEHKDAAWTLVKEEDRRDYAVTESITLNSDVTLEVRLTDHIYTLTVRWVGGTLATIKQAYNTDVTAPATEKAGYTFVAFYLENEQGGEFTFGKMPGQDVTVWAKYEILDSTLKFATGNGGTAIADVVKKTGEMVDKPADPERTGYEFVKWQIAGSDVQWLVKDGTSANPEYYINMPGGTTTMTAVWDMTEEGKAALKEQKIDELEAYAAELGVQLPDNATTGISNASTEEAILAAFDAAKAAADELKTALDAAKAAAKAEVNAAATAAGVDAPSLAAIDSATSVEAVNTAKTATLAKVAEAKASKDKVDAAKAAVAALQGKSGAELYGLIKAADTALNALSADEKAQVNLEAYNQAKTAYSAFVAGVNADLEVAEKAGASMVAVSFASVAALAMLAFVLKRRMF